MDPRKLIYLASIVEHGSFKKAAKSLEISQPALSTSMDRLEQSVGCKLLDRSPVGVAPTPMGELLYAHARLIRDEVQLASARVCGRDIRGDNVVAVGTLPSLMAAIMPQAICQWRKANPDPSLRITEKIQLELILSLIRGDLDFIIAATENYGFIEGLKQRVLFRDRLYVIANPDHPAHEIQGVSFANLTEFPWVIQMVGRHRTLLEKAMSAEGVEVPERLTECGSVTCIKTLVAGTDSLAMLPASAIASDVRAGHLKCLDIHGPLLHRDIAVIFRDQIPISDAGRALVDEVTAVGLSVGSSGNEDELVGRDIAA
ncbi:MAG TPA: LysR family transcriptional regulator [Bosea sp. (in: a-proteobacteria)]